MIEDPRKFSLKVSAIIVTYFAEIHRLRELLSSLVTQVEFVIVVDNTPGGDRLVFDAVNQECTSGQFEVIGLQENRGIATAINIGVQRARKLASQYVVLFDQDSVPNPLMIEQLLMAVEQLTVQGRKVGAVGPVYFDEAIGITTPLQVKRKGHFFYSKLLPAPNEITECLSLISSGSMISIRVFDSVGEMKDDWFIDNVDIEWGFRAISRGYSLFGVGSAVMRHRRGGQSLPVWLFGWRSINFYPPPRMYYQFRNWIALLKLQYVPVNYKVRSLVYWLGMFYGYVFFTNQRREYIKCIFRGIRDGYVSRFGCYED